MRRLSKALLALIQIFILSLLCFLIRPWQEGKVKGSISLFPLRNGGRALASHLGNSKIGFSLSIANQKLEKTRVGVVKEATIQESVREAISLAGGLSFIEPGDTVLVKPNVNSYDPYPGTTNPEVVGEVVRMVKEAGAKRVIVADRSGPGWYSDTMYNMEKVGIAQAAREAGAEVVALEKEEWIRVQPKGAKYWKRGFRIPKLVEEVDHIINVPVAKTHRGATFSMSLKNFVGLISRHDRNLMHLSKHWKEMIAELNLAFEPKLNVMDASKVFVSGGPAVGKTESPGIIIASSDRIATDLTGLNLLKILGTTPQIQSQNMWNHPQIKRASELGIGISSHTAVQLLSLNLEFDIFFPSLEKN